MQLSIIILSESLPTMDNNNVPIGSIQRILGHENRTTTEIYLHSIGDQERNALRLMKKCGKSPTQSLTRNKKIPQDKILRRSLTILFYFFLVGRPGIEPRTY